MSVEQEHDPRIHTPKHTSPLPETTHHPNTNEPPHVGADLSGPSPIDLVGGQGEPRPPELNNPVIRRGRLIAPIADLSARVHVLAPYRWFLTHTFTPLWLPKQWRHPVVGYVVAILLQLIAIFATLLLLQIFPSFTFTALLEVLAVALVALNWGAGPSLAGTVIGAALLNYVVQPPRFTWSLGSPTNLVELFLFLLVGVTISIVASKFERERRNTEELAVSLATERTRLEAIIETVPDALSIHDKQGTVVHLNRQGRQNTGPDRGNEALEDTQQAYSVRTVTGELFAVKDLPVSRALRGEIVSNVELRFLNAEGQDTYALMSAAPLYDSEGQVDGAVLITHDITRLHQSEREIAIRASELEAIFESITDGIFLFNSDKQIIRMNGAARDLLALNGQEDSYLSRPADQRVSLLNMRDEYGQLLPEEQIPISRILNGEVLKGSNSDDVIIRALNGQELELNVSGTPMHSPEGHLIGALCICRDVTQRRQLERRTQTTLNALLTMAETLVLVSDSSTPSGELPSSMVGAPLTGALGPGIGADLSRPSPIYRPRSEGVSKIAHRMAELTCSVLGCQRVSITAVEPETEVLHPIAVVGLPPEQERQWWAEQQHGVRLGDGSDPTIASQLRANQVLFLDMMQPPFSDLPNPYHIRVVLITPMIVGDQLVGLLSLDYGGETHEYTSEEISLAKAVARLAALVIERDRLLRERAEARAGELALREANRRMDEFLGMTSHELKTPLTSIKGNTQLTVRQLRNSLQNFQKMHEMLEGTERQIKLLDRLVDDLLDISRTQADHLELSLAPCDLAAVVRQAVNEQRRIWPNRTISLDVPEHMEVFVQGDADRLSQVVTNYLTNALKYSSEERPVQASLSVGDRLIAPDSPASSNTVTVSVRDEGVGLSPEAQQQLWQRFHRTLGVEVQSPAGSANAGLGLGLYICKAIIEQHHGAVGVESTPNLGSNFWFTLPLAK